MAPTAEKLTFPAVYGSPKRTLAWDAVRARLEEATVYWLATVRSDGRPHVVPLDGIWVDDVWYFGGAPDTVHQRTLAAHPDAVMHLPDPGKVVVVEGTAERLTPSPGEAQRLAEAATAKYPEYGPRSAADYAEAVGLRPRRVLAWFAFPTDATRFLFDG